MKKIALPLAASLLVMSFFAFSPSPAMAHVEMISGDIKIVGGWVDEPPLVGHFNGIELEISRVSDGQPITNAIAQLDVSIKKGTPIRALDFQPQEELGVYVAEILPTQTGQYSMVIMGMVAGQAIDGQIEIEDVEDTARFNFPPASSNDPDPLLGEIIKQLQTVISDLSAQVDEAKLAAEEAKTAATSATESSTDLKMAADRAYLFGIIGVGVGIAGIAIGVVALSRKEKI